MTLAYGRILRTMKCGMKNQSIIKVCKKQSFIVQYLNIRDNFIDDHGMKGDNYAEISH